MNKTDKLPQATTTTAAPPCIIGNIQATNLLPSNVSGVDEQHQNGLLIPASMMGLPATVNDNQLIRILPIFIQGSHPHPPGDIVIDPSQVVGVNDIVNTSIDNNSSKNCSSTPSIYYSHSLQQQPTLASSDTVILESSASNLASANTLPLSASSSEVVKTTGKPPTEQRERNEKSTSLHTAFSLVSALSDKSIDLESIPTINLFKADQKEDQVGEIGNVNTSNKFVGSIQSKSSFVGSNNNTDLSSNGYQTRSKSKRERNSAASESDTNRLQIDESVVESADTDTDGEDEAFPPSIGEKKENSLTRDDTVILSTTTGLTHPTQNQSSLTSSDTLIIPSGSFIKLLDSKPVMTSVSSSGGLINTCIPSIPTLMLTDSVVEGTVNPSLLCNFLSRPSQNHIQNPSTKSITLEQLLSAANLNLIASPQNSCQGIPESISLQCSAPGSSQSITISSPCSSQGTVLPVLSTNMSVKGTQTDWILGNMPVSFTPPNPSPTVIDNSRNMPVSFTPPNPSPTVIDNSRNMPVSFTPPNPSPTVIDNSRNMPVSFTPPNPSPTVIDNSRNMPVSFTPPDPSPTVIDNSRNIPVSFTPPNPSHSHTISHNSREQPVCLGNTPLVMEDLQDETNTPVSSSYCMNTRPNEVAGETNEQTNLSFPCTDAECEQTSSSKVVLGKHEKSQKKILKCDLCSSTFTRMGNYTRHRKIHSLKPDQQLFTCAQCNREFLQRCDLKRHLLIHSNQQPYRCQICGKGYIRKSDLVVHMRFHNKDKAYQCNVCDKKFCQSGDLSRHFRRTHKPNTQLTCGHCERKYACEVTLIRHMKLVHKDIILNTVNQSVPA